MSNDFQSLDIILFAMIAIFLALRLRSVLGRRDGNDSVSKRERKPEDSRPGQSSKVIELPVKSPNDNREEEKATEIDESPKNKWASSKMDKEIQTLSNLDPTFSKENSTPPLAFK